MSPKELQKRSYEKLIAELRHPRQRNERYYEPLCARAADEIERLALAQPDAEPVAWREALEQQLLDLVELARDTRSDRGGEARWTHPIGALTHEFANRITAPPRPDSSAGLIEAAEIVEGLAKEFERRHDELKQYSLNNDNRWIDFYPRIAQGCEEAAQAIRARAAERGGKP